MRHIEVVPRNIGGTYEIWHGESISGRLLVDREQGGKKYPVDVLWPGKITGQVDISSMDEGAYAFLSGLVTMLRPENILEIGTHKGRGTAALAEAAVWNGVGHVTTIDYQDFNVGESGALTKDQLAITTFLIGHTPECYLSEPLKSMSGIDFAFVDGDHSAEGLKADLEYIEAHRAKECVICVDNSRDVTWPDVHEVMSGFSGCVSLPSCTGMDVVVFRDDDVRIDFRA